MDGLRHGYGEFYDTDGGVFKGFWIKDDQHGEGFYLDADGGLFRQVWKKGKLLDESQVINNAG
jgi:hypothetical protein